MTAQAWIAAVVGCAAITDDLASRRISNWIPLSAFVSGLTLQTIENGWRGAGSATLGALAGAAAFIVFYLLGGMGGGDIKLMGGFGAVLGPSHVLIAALWTAGVGGILAAVVIGVGSIRRYWRSSRNAPLNTAAPSSGPVDRIPYAPAIALGAWLSLAAKASGIPG